MTAASSTSISGGIAWKSLRAAASCPTASAADSGETPFLSVAPASAPAANSCCTTSSCPHLAAMSSGVPPASHGLKRPGDPCESGEVDTDRTRMLEARGDSRCAVLIRRTPSLQKAGHRIRVPRPGRDM